MDNSNNEKSRTEMRIDHRMKASETLKAAKLSYDNGLVFPTYQMLKESLRATFAFIIEDSTEMVIAEKTRLQFLFDNMNITAFKDETQYEELSKFLEWEKLDLYDLLRIDIEEFRQPKKHIREFIIGYLDIDPLKDM